MRRLWFQEEIQASAADETDETIDSLVDLWQKNLHQIENEGEWRATVWDFKTLCASGRMDGGWVDLAASERFACVIFQQKEAWYLASATTAVEDNIWVRNQNGSQCKESDLSQVNVLINATGRESERRLVDSIE